MTAQGLELRLDPFLPQPFVAAEIAVATNVGVVVVVIVVVESVIEADVVVVA